MMRHTGGWACGATSTRSRSSSLARDRASCSETMPICWPSAPTIQTWGARTRSLMRGSREIRHHLVVPERTRAGGWALKADRRVRTTSQGSEYRERPLTRLGRPSEPRRASPPPSGPGCKRRASAEARLHWIGRRRRASRRLDVGCLLALRPVHDVELNLLTLREGAVAVADDRREVNEDVIALRGRDEAIALLVAEPLDGPFGQPGTSLHTSRRTARRRAGA